MSQQTMKRFFRHITLFLTGCLLLYLPAVWIVGLSGLRSNVKYVPDNYGHMGLRMAEADSLCAAGGADLVFIGSSHCYRTFDTRCYDSAGFHSFNLGSSNQTPKQSLVLIERYLRHWPVKLAVIEVHPDIMGNSGAESAADIVSNTDADLRIASMVVGTKSIRAINTMICSKIDRLIRRHTRSGDNGSVHIKSSSGGEEMECDFTYIPGGFVEVTPYCWTPTPLNPYTINVRDDQLQALSKCLLELDRMGIPYLLVEVPSTRCRYLSYTNHDEFERKIRSLTNHNSLYINLNEDDELMSQLDDSTCFFDDDHLNSKGAAIVNRYLIECEKIK